MAFDVITPANLGRGAISISPTVDTFHTVEQFSRSMLKAIDLPNTASAPARVTVYLVPSGGSPGAGNVLIPSVRIPGNGIFQWTGTQVMNEGDTIQATSSAAGTAIQASGAVCT